MRFARAVSALLGIALPLSAADWNGTWVGGTNALGQYAFVQLEITPAGATIELPSEDVVLALRNVTNDGATVAFRLPSPFGEFAFAGERNGDVVRGRLETPMGTDAEMHFQRTGVCRSTPADYAAAYMLPGGEAVIVMARRGQLRLVNTRTLISTRLVPVAGDRFLDAASVVEDPAKGHELAFVRDAAGTISGLSVGGVVAKRTDLLDQEAVTFPNGDVRLGGTFIKPHGAPRGPAAVVVHGSGHVTRDPLLQRAQLLLRMGVPVLLYDKRGTGESSGDWRIASLDDLAGDASAAVRYLRTRADVDPNKIGVVGHSQAGWIIPIVAARDAGIAFTIIASGGAVSPFDQEVFRAEAQTHSAEAVALTTAMWTYAKTGAGWDDYLKAWTASTGKRWFRRIAGPRTPDDVRWAQMRHFAGYDPLPTIKRLTTPTLVILGKNDENVPADRTADLWRSNAGRNVEVVVVPDTGHNLMVRQKEGSVYAPQYVEAMRKWLEARGIVAKGASLW